jgi:hypothetical protein
LIKSRIFRIFLTISNHIKLSTQFSIILSDLPEFWLGMKCGKGNNKRWVFFILFNVW